MKGSESKLKRQQTEPAVRRFGVSAVRPFGVSAVRRFGGTAVRRYNARSIRVVFFRVGRRRSLVVVDGVEFLFIRLGVVEIGHLFRRRRHLRFFVLAAA